MVDQLNRFAGEVTRVAREVGTEGKLGGQANVPGVGGTWKGLTDNVNSMASNLTGQVRNIAEVTTAVARQPSEMRYGGPGRRSHPAQRQSGLSSAFPGGRGVLHDLDQPGNRTGRLRRRKRKGFDPSVPLVERQPVVAS